MFSLGDANLGAPEMADLVAKRLWANEWYERQRRLMAAVDRVNANCALARRPIEIVAEAQRDSCHKRAVRVGANFTTLRSCRMEDAGQVRGTINNSCVRKDYPRYLSSFATAPIQRRAPPGGESEWASFCLCHDLCRRNTLIA